ncbi:MAG: hypothetical protein ABS76_14305 [Pelagibacterium sp. SCN 64-44]|nr:MAG: hypothetical protein ABS76_14305 [Pelagibacterium sp. SCN 64-44]
MEAPVIIREFSPIRGLRLFTSIPEGMRIVRIDGDRPGSIYTKGMYVLIDPSRTDLVEGIDVALVATGGPLDGFEPIAVVVELCRAFSGWCTAPGGGGHSQVIGAGKPLRMVDGPQNPEGLQRRIIGAVVGYLGESWGEPIRDLWPLNRGLPWREDAYERDDLPSTYVCQCEGVCLVPVYQDGARLLFDATALIEPGDYVCLWLKPRFYHEGIKYQCMVKRLVTPLPIGPFPLPDEMPAPPVILVEMLNPARTFVVPLNRLEAIHKCQGEYEGRHFKRTHQQMRGYPEAERTAAGGGN